MTKPGVWAPDDPSLNHVALDVLVRLIDDELSSSEAAHVELHLSHCEECKQRYQDLRALSDRVDVLVSATAPRSSADAREVLARTIERRQSEAVVPLPGKILHRFGWGMAIAATLALGVVFGPGRVHTATDTASESSARPPVETFEVNGEKFVALPYSNPDLTVSASHIVQMQIPVSSLADAGVAFEPVSTQETVIDHSVLADILVGMDGQPLGVHVLSAE